MSGLSDRDQKIILVLLTIMVIVLPYSFFIKDKKIEIATIKEENVALGERLAYLQELDTHRDEYVKETEEMNKERDLIVASFPEDIKQENYTMFLLNTEYSSDVIVNPETGAEELEYPIVIDTVSYGANVEYPISSEDADTGLSSVVNTSNFSYSCKYDGLKYFLDYLMNYEDPMAYRSITMDYDTASGVINGTISFSQYAIKGNDRVLPAVDIKPAVERGNQEVGIFGPYSSAASEEEEDNAVVVEEEAADESEE